MEVLDGHHHRAACAELVEQVEHCLGDAELTLRGRVGPDRPCPQVLVHTLTPGRSGGADAVRDRGERAIRLELLRVRAEHNGARAASELEDRLDEPGLADPSLALDGDDPAAAPHGADDRFERSELRLATDERWPVEHE